MAGSIKNRVTRANNRRKQSNIRKGIDEALGVDSKKPLKARTTKERKRANLSAAAAGQTARGKKELAHAGVSKGVRTDRGTSLLRKKDSPFTYGLRKGVTTDGTAETRVPYKSGSLKTRKRIQKAKGAATSLWKRFKE